MKTSVLCHLAVLGLWMDGTCMSLLYDLRSRREVLGYSLLWQLLEKTEYWERNNACKTCVMIMLFVVASVNQANFESHLPSLVHTA